MMVAAVCFEWPPHPHPHELLLLIPSVLKHLKKKKRQSEVCPGSINTRDSLSCLRSLLRQSWVVFPPLSSLSPPCWRRPDLYSWWLTVAACMDGCYGWSIRNIKAHFNSSVKPFFPRCSSPDSARFITTTLPFSFFLFLVLFVYSQLLSLPGLRSLLLFTLQQQQLFLSFNFVMTQSQTDWKNLVTSGRRLANNNNGQKRGRTTCPEAPHCLVSRESVVTFWTCRLLVVFEEGAVQCSGLCEEEYKGVSLSPSLIYKPVMT